MKGPEQEPDNSTHTKDDFQDWKSYKSPEKTSAFSYSDSTEQHIEQGESQKFHYEGNDLPEKM